MFGTNRKVLPQGMHPCNMKALSRCLKKLYLRLNFLKSRSKSKVKVMRSTFLYGQKVLVTKSTHLLYENPVSLGSKVEAKVKFTLDRQTDGQTG